MSPKLEPRMMQVKTFFAINPPENKSDMLPKDSLGLVCPKCGMLLDEDYINPNFKIPRNSPDLSSTYDGYRIASAKFRDVIESSEYGGIEFRLLPGSPGFFAMKVENELKLTRPPELKFEELCSECDRYVSVWGWAAVALIIPPHVIVDGLYRCDLKMGYRNLMLAPLIATRRF